jgi:hypothetical protein
MEPVAVVLVALVFLAAGGYLGYRVRLRQDLREREAFFRTLLLDAFEEHRDAWESRRSHHVNAAEGRIGALESCVRQFLGLKRSVYPIHVQYGADETVREAYDEYLKRHKEWVEGGLVKAA